MSNVLNKKRLLEIKGGSAKYFIAAAIIGFGTFIIGIIDGLVRPLKCYRRR